MSTEEKVLLVRRVEEEYGLTPALAALELARSTLYYHRSHRFSYEEKYAHLSSLLEEISRKLSEYWCRRTTEELRKGFGMIINHKVVQRLHRLWDLLWS